MPEERSVFDLNIEYESVLAAKRQEFWAKTPKTDALKAVREIVKVRKLEELPEVKSRLVSTIQRNGYRIEKLALEPKPNVVLPALAFLPARPGELTYLYLNDQGKQADASVGGAIEKIVHKGHIVLAVDMRGFGETKHSGKKWYGGIFGPNAGHFYLTYLLGKSLISLWTEDVLICARFLKNYQSNGLPRKRHRQPRRAECPR